MGVAHDLDPPIPAALREAVRDGWRGLSVGELAAGGPVALVCAADAARLPALAERGLWIGLPLAPPGDGPRCVVIAVGGAPDMTLTLDLASAGVREVVGQIGAFEALDVVWVRGEDAVPVRTDLVLLSDETAERLRAEAA
jgi:hypothetical protein